MKDEKKIVTEPLVSIIVPVYNLENYIEKTINSVLNQTYTNFEIILVNDGSTDQTLDVCKTISKKDERIKLFSKSNGGLSDARNYGMKNCNGDYFTFLDGDDLLDKDFIRLLVNKICMSNSDIALGSLCRNENTHLEENINQDSVEKKELLINAFKGINPAFTQSACGKLFSRRVIDDLTFPLGRYYEDEFTMYHLFLKFKCCVDNSAKYIYVKREGSITQSKDHIKKQIEDQYYALEKVVNEIKITYPNLSYITDYKILVDGLAIIKHGIELKEPNKYVNKIIVMVKKLNASNLKRVGLNRSYKIQFYLIKYAYQIYKLIFSMMKKIHINREY